MPPNLRGWHAAGQTWLVWTAEPGVEEPEGYEVYASRSPDLAGAVRIGRVLPADWQARRAREIFKRDDLTWRIPDGRGGTYTLGAEEALFVHTPHEAVREWLSVVRAGETRLSVSEAVAVDQTTEPVEAHLQSIWRDEEGHTAHHFAHWTDGRACWTDARADYPVMGNADFHGTAHLFAVWEPLGGAPPLAPAVFCLHWRKGHYNTWRPMSRLSLDLRLDGVRGLLVSVDDWLWLIDGEGAVRGEHTRWAGYAEGFERFNPRRRAPEAASDRLILYSCARVDWVRGWVMRRFGADPRRSTVLGYSMGSAGAHQQVVYRPESWAASAHFEGPVEAAEADLFEGELACLLTGSGEAGLPVNLPDSCRALGPSTWPRLYRPHWRCSAPDLPVARYVWGGNDRAVPWDSGKHRAIDLLEGCRRGAAVFWDERNHRIEGWNEPAFEGAPVPRWSSTPGIATIEPLTRHRADRSFPAFSRDEHSDNDVTAPWGTRNGYFDWDPETLEDEPDGWAATLLVSGVEAATADVTLRRAQRFRPAPGTALRWEVRREGILLDQGEVTVDEYGEVTIPGVTVTSPTRLTVRLPS